MPPDAAARLPRRVGHAASCRRHRRPCRTRRRLPDAAAVAAYAASSPPAPLPTPPLPTPPPRRYAAAVRADAVAIEQGRAVAEIVAAPLWPGEMPEPIAEAWDRLRTWMLEDEANNWHPWVQWYERVRDGRPSFGEAFDLAVASLTDEQWNEEPVPAAVNRRIAALLAEHTTPEPIPPQGPGPHFTLSPDLRIALAPPAELDADGNNLARIRQLLPRRARGRRRPRRPSQPEYACPRSARNLSAYRAAIAGDRKRSPGASCSASASGSTMPPPPPAARSRTGLQPPLEDAAQEALDYGLSPCTAR